MGENGGNRLVMICIKVLHLDTNHDSTLLTQWGLMLRDRLSGL